MFYIKIADMIVGIENKYDFIKNMCKDYICSEQTADMIISVTDADIAAETTDDSYPPAYLETLAVYRKISDKLTAGDGLLMHGVILETDGKGVAFLADSGTGKSTHMFLWKKLLKDKCTVVNGDKPLIRFKDGVPYAYGTPWAGKERIQTNTKVPLNKICFLERAKENSTISLEKKDVLARLYSHIYLPKGGLSRLEIFDKLDKLINFADFYTIRCNMEPEAAEISYNTIIKDNM